MAQLGRWSAVQQPDAVIAPADSTGARESPHRRGDGRAMRADEIGQPLMGKRQGHGDTLRSDAAPAFGQVPQRQQQAVFDAWMVGDCQGNCQRMRPAGAPGKQLKTELGPGSHARDEALIEHSQLGRLEHRPSHFRVNMRPVRIPPPRTQNIALAEQLDALAAHHMHLAREQPVDDQKAAMVDVRLNGADSIPLADRQVAHASQRLSPGALALVLVQQIRQIRVGVDDADEIGQRAHGNREGSVPVVGFAAFSGRAASGMSQRLRTHENTFAGALPHGA